MRTVAIVYAMDFLFQHQSETCYKKTILYTQQNLSVKYLADTISLHTSRNCFSNVLKYLVRPFLNTFKHIMQHVKCFNMIVVVFWVFFFKNYYAPVNQAN